MKTITYAGKDLYNLYSINIWFIFPRTTYNTNFAESLNFVFWVDQCDTADSDWKNKRTIGYGVKNGARPHFVHFIIIGWLFSYRSGPFFGPLSYHHPKNCSKSNFPIRTPYQITVSLAKRTVYLEVLKICKNAHFRHDSNFA